MPGTTARLVRPTVPLVGPAAVQATTIPVPAFASRSTAPVAAGPLIALMTLPRLSVARAANVADPVTGLTVRPTTRRLLVPRPLMLRKDAIGPVALATTRTVVGLIPTTPRTATLGTLTTPTTVTTLATLAVGPTVRQLPAIRTTVLVPSPLPIPAVAVKVVVAVTATAL